MAVALATWLSVTCGILATCAGDILDPLFGANPPDYVKVRELPESLKTVTDKIAARLKCEEYGVERNMCTMCLDASSLLPLLRLDPLSGQVSRTQAEDLAVLVSHQVLFFESMCLSRAAGCQHFEDCQDEVMELMGRYASPVESLVKVLRIFKMYLKEEPSGKCFSARDVLDELPRDTYGSTALQEYRQVFAVVVGRILKGQCIEIGESVTDFLDDIFHHYGDNCSPYMNLDGLKGVIRDLQSGKGEGHAHSHSHSHGHDEDDADHRHHDHDCEHLHPHFAPYHSHGYYPHDDHDQSSFHHNGTDHPHHDDPSYHEGHQDNDHHHGHSHPYGVYEHNSSFVSPVPVELGSQGADVTGPSANSSGTNALGEYSRASDASATTPPGPSTSRSSSSLRTDEPSTTKRPTTQEVSTSSRRAPRSAPGEANGPSASLKSDLSVPEDERAVTGPPPADDVKKVYLLHGDHRNDAADLEPSGTPHRFASMAAKCLSAEDLLSKFGHEMNGSLSKGDFLDLCPALVQQIVSGVCTEPVRPPSQPLPSRSEIYGYGSLSVLVITLTSLAGVLLLPVMTKHAYHYIIAGFYGLAFSTLAADALLHLMPQFLGLHSHGPGNEHDHSHEGGYLEPYVQMQLGVFFTIYALFLFEAVMCAFTGESPHSHGGGKESKGHGHSHSLPDTLPTLISVKSKSETTLSVSRDQSTSSLDTEVVDMEDIKKPPNLMVNQPIFCGLTSLAIVVTLGDSIHNFGDGLAIGAAFSTGVRGGLSTAIAVFCHELPHEFGDFVVLLSTGLSFSKALWINFASGLTAFAGLYIGVAIGDDESARKWVMAVTAGIFLYVALGEMLPELKEHHHGSRVKMLLVKNFGILSGIAIMFLISVYEEQLA